MARCRASWRQRSARYNRRILLIEVGGRRESGGKDADVSSPEVLRQTLAHLNVTCTGQASRLAIMVLYVFKTNREYDSYSCIGSKQ